LRGLRKEKNIRGSIEIVVAPPVKSAASPSANQIVVLRGSCRHIRRRMSPGRHIDKSARAICANAGFLGSECSSTAGRRTEADQACSSAPDLHRKAARSKGSCVCVRGRCANKSRPSGGVRLSQRLGLCGRVNVRRRSPKFLLPRGTIRGTTSSFKRKYAMKTVAYKIQWSE